MATQANDIADLIKATQDELGELRWTHLASSLQNHLALREVIANNKVSLRGGTNIDYTIMTGNSGAAKHVGLYNTDAVNVADQLQTATVRWAHATTNYAIDDREVSMNASPRRIVELVKVRRADAMTALADLIEEKFFTDILDHGTAYTDDGSAPYGLDYWLMTDNVGSATGGFVPGRTAGPGGLDTTVYNRYTNYNFDMDNATPVAADDIDPALDQAAEFCGFNPIPGVDAPEFYSGRRYAIYTTFAMKRAAKEGAQGRNDSLGFDIDPLGSGGLTFRGTPVMWCPQMETWTVCSQPFVGLDWGSWEVNVLDGEYMNESGPMKASNMHKVNQVHVDLTYQFVCRDLRRNFVVWDGQ